jgi:hypothetical protein
MASLLRLVQDLSRQIDQVARQVASVLRARSAECARRWSS